MEHITKSKVLKSARNLGRSLIYFGSARLCPVCSWASRQFMPAGNPKRQDAECPHCGAKERHRLVWLYLNRCTNLFDGGPKRILHVAPEACFKDRLRRLLGDNYTTADLTKPADVHFDITDNPYRDGWFDVVLCSHVLEHVPDDKQAMREFRRVLAPGGWAILLVPVDWNTPITFEDSTVTDPRERLRLFGQRDHVRRYSGADYVGRLREAGFGVYVISVSDVVSDSEAVLMGLATHHHAGEIYLCRKVADVGASSIKG